MLSLSPRYDLFKFQFPKDFLPKELDEKYAKLLAKNNSVLVSPIEYLNESIQGVTFPGITELTTEQDQISHNMNFTMRSGSNLAEFKQSTEPVHKNTYISPINPLAAISKEFKVTMRQNQGLYNYWMMYEAVFWKVLKTKQPMYDECFTLFIMNEVGEACARVDLYDNYITGIDGLEFNYNKVDRQSDTFDVTFNFNNIDFNLIEDIETV